MSSSKIKQYTIIFCCMCLLAVISVGLPALALSQPIHSDTTPIDTGEVVPGSSEVMAQEPVSLSAEPNASSTPQMHEDDKMAFELGTMLLLALGLIALGLVRYKIRQ